MAAGFFFYTPVIRSSNMKSEHIPGTWKMQSFLLMQAPTNCTQVAPGTSNRCLPSESDCGWVAPTLLRVGVNCCLLPRLPQKFRAFPSLQRSKIATLECTAVVV